MENRIHDEVEKVRKQIERPDSMAPIEGLIRYSERRMQPPKQTAWIVDSMLVRGQITVVAGEGGIGKSWWALHIAQKILTGGMVHDMFQAEKGNVLWYDNENGADENDRRSRLLDRLMPMVTEDRDIYYQEVPRFFFKADDVCLPRMKQHIEAIKPALIIIDSLVSIFPEGTSENVSTEVRAMMNSITQTLQSVENPPALLILSHTKKSAEEDGWSLYRGSSDIQNSVSLLLAMRGVEWEDDKGNKTKRAEFKWIKSRMAKPPEGIYQYEVQDCGEPETPEHWVKYESFGKTKPFDERLADWILDTLTEPRAKRGIELSLSIAHPTTEGKDISQAINLLIQTKRIVPEQRGQVTYYKKP